MKRRILLSSLLLAAAAFAVLVGHFGASQRGYFVERAGTVARAEVSPTRLPAGIGETAHIVSSTGLEIRLRTLRPVSVPGERLPVLLILGGHETGRNAVDLVGNADGIAFAAIDYPYRGGHDLDGLSQTAAAVPLIQQAFRDTPPALSLALTWLLEQPWVDPGRAELAGVSLGVPFAAAAGALDKRFSRVWLLHGGADNQSWVEHAGRDGIRNAAMRRMAASAALFLVYGRSFDTREWLREIAPRPVVIVAARNDDYVPPAAQAPFVEAAERPGIELIWTEGLHIQPNRSDELAALLAIVRSRMAGASVSAPGVTLSR